MSEELAWNKRPRSYAKLIQSCHLPLCLQAEIEKFVVMSANNNVGQAGKRDRENCDPDSVKTKTAKIEQGSDVDNDIVLSENGQTRCLVKAFKGTTYVDIRSYYKVCRADTASRQV